ncbi:hypothetical protein QJQ45_011330 [Haematococcus lacustris]|nr:hypothetical protein QJQ45_011330 [Haematococcus lacustris]
MRTPARPLRLDGVAESLYLSRNKKRKRPVSPATSAAGASGSGQQDLNDKGHAVKEVTAQRRLQQVVEQQHQLQQQQADLHLREQQVAEQHQLQQQQQADRLLREQHVMEQQHQLQQQQADVLLRERQVAEQQHQLQQQQQADRLLREKHVAEQHQLQQQHQADMHLREQQVMEDEDQAVKEPVELPVIGRQLTATSDFNPDTHVVVGVDPGVTQTKATHAERDPATGKVSRQLEWELTKGQLKHDNGLTKAKRDAAR